MTGRFITWAASLIFALAVFGMAAQAASIDPLGQAGAAASAHSSMLPGCKSCDATSISGIHCGVPCAPSAAILNPTTGVRSPGGLAYAAMPIVLPTGLTAEPDYSPPK
jgi:hypothetical protein